MKACRKIIFMRVTDTYLLTGKTNSIFGDKNVSHVWKTSGSVKLNYACFELKNNFLHEQDKRAFN